MNANEIIRLDFGFVSAYLARGERGFVLFDTGTGGHRAKLEAALGAADCKRGDLALVVITHADHDHAGNCPWLREAFGAPIAIHGADAAMLETGIAPQRSMRGLLRLLNPLLGLSKSGKPICKPDILLTDNQDLSPWGLAAKVLHLPGHTPGAIGILTASGAFIAGDVLANWRRPAASPFVHDAEAYGRSISRARELIPSTATVYPGHGAPFPATALRDIGL